ncbi:mannose-1-phosphate guanylyltransferase [Halalkalibaculum sp. DA3122]|uniref:mannose-1-phosphate guanylyltransferase n=1 Tax=Halalkalibaculum sp. DA3122 TaxID=3373607 RepID=UPI003753F501
MLKPNIQLLNMLHAVIMAGGSGTRFWPKSTRETPKQFLNLFGDKTMLQMTADRIRKRIPVEQILVITNDRYIGLVEQQLPDLPGENIVGEPVAKNTAPCVAFAAGLLRQRDPDATMVVLPADHYIRQEQRFISILEAAAAKAEEDCLVTIGIQPERAETGYGYIEFDSDSGETVNGHDVRKVNKFTEKPNKQKAREFISAGNYLWNSGMFVWKATTIIEQFQAFQPEIYTQLKKLATADPNSPDTLRLFYEHCPSVSIDYGIMEHAKSVFVVPGKFGWNDVGSWTALYELRDKDEHGNVVQTQHLKTEQASNNLVQTQSDKMIALVGVENLAIVETDKAILICNLDKAQGVKKIVTALEESEETKSFL